MYIHTAFVNISVYSTFIWTKNSNFKNKSSQKINKIVNENKKLSTIYLYMYVYIYIYISIYLSIYLSIFLSIYLYIYLSTFLSNYLDIYLSIYLFKYLSIYLLVVLRSRTGTWGRRGAVPTPSQSHQQLNCWSRLDDHLKIFYFRIFFFCKFFYW